MATANSPSNENRRVQADGAIVGSPYLRRVPARPGALWSGAVILILSALTSNRAGGPAFRAEVVAMAGKPGTATGKSAGTTGRARRASKPAQRAAVKDTTDVTPDPPASEPAPRKAVKSAAQAVKAAPAATKVTPTVSKAAPTATKAAPTAAPKPRKAVTGRTSARTAAATTTKAAPTTARAAARKTTRSRKAAPGPAPSVARPEHAGFQVALTARLAELRAEYDQAAGDLADLQLSRVSDGAGDDQADTGTKTFEREQELSLVHGIQERVQQVEHALSRLADGSYGDCERCGNPIPTARLEAFPSVTLCVTCKQIEERR
jgi:DnaK suppressor protein